MTVLDPTVDSLKYEIEEEAPQRASIKIVGVGGGGLNAVAYMLNSGLEGVEFYVLDTDVQALEASPVPNKLAIGAKITRGRGTGADPALGRQAALDDTERIIEILQGAEMVFITAGLGNGVGTGATPVVASLARQLHALTVALVTKPFELEGALALQQAQKGLHELAATVDTVIAVPNDHLLALAPRGTSVLEALRMGHDLLLQMVADLLQIITTPGLINRDLSDIRSTMYGMGHAVMCTAVAQGDNAALEAARQAVSSPLIQPGGIQGARSILINITGSSRLGFHQVHEACALIRKAAQCEQVRVNFGILLNESLGDTVKVTLIATGFPPPEARPTDGQEVFAHETWTQPAPLQTSASPPAPPLPKEPDDLDDLDTPAFLRQRKVVH